MEPVAAALAAALAILILLRRPGALAPVLAFEAGRTFSPPGEEEEQLPETDRAPRPWLPVCVATVAAVRLVLLLTLHA
jgi:hypothetical protein